MVDRASWLERQVQVPRTLKARAVARKKCEQRRSCLYDTNYARKTIFSDKYTAFVFAADHVLLLPVLDTSLKRLILW